MSLDDDIAALEQIELLSEFDRDHLRLIAFGSHKHSHTEGHVIFREGQASDGGYLILSGSVSISSTQDGEKTHIADYGPGALLGEMSLIIENKRSYTATVKENCQLFKITHNTMQRVLSEYPELAITLHARISRNLAELTEGLPSVQEKLKLDEKDLEQSS